MSKAKFAETVDKRRVVMVPDARRDLRHEEQVFTFPEDASHVNADSPCHVEKSRNVQQGSKSNTSSEQ